MPAGSCQNAVQWRADFVPHVREELTFDPASFFRCRLRLFLFPLLLLALRHIVNEGGKQATFSQLKGRDGGLGRELMTIAVTGS